MVKDMERWGGFPVLGESSSSGIIMPIIGSGQ